MWFLILGAGAVVFLLTRKGTSAPAPAAEPARGIRQPRPVATATKTPASPPSPYSPPASSDSSDGPKASAWLRDLLGGSGEAPVEGSATADGDHASGGSVPGSTWGDKFKS